ncbi:uncharacterized protein isoform X2 [Rhodnius prolixus]|uniref:uncharacterized protein isoform X2 n=1 Tax=Rhodnius prolixus TaxID=13249 RepID=UPI003D18C344
MSSDSDNDCKPLHYETPSPYKKRKPVGLCTRRKSLKSNKNLDGKLEEILKIEDKYNKRILESINTRLVNKENIYVDQQRLVDEFISNSFSGDNRKTPTSVANDVVSPALNSMQSFKYYFSPNNYFNKFNQDLLKPNHFFSDKSILGKLTIDEIIKLIKSDSLDIEDEMREKNDLVKFLMNLGSVTDSILITGRLTQLLSETAISYLDFVKIVENWGRVDQATEKCSYGKPQVHNFTFILEKLALSIKLYSMVEVKEIFQFLINVSLDPLLIHQGHNLLRPLYACINNLQDKGMNNEQIVDLIDHEQWSIYCSKQIVFLLLNCRASKEIAILLGFRVLSKILTEQCNKTSTVDMEALFEIFKTGEEKLIALDLHSFQQIFLLFELIAYKIPDREKFDIGRLVKFVEKIKRRFSVEIKSVYTVEIINRMRMMWRNFRK